MPQPSGVVAAIVEQRKRGTELAAVVAETVMGVVQPRRGSGGDGSVWQLARPSLSVRKVNISLIFLIHLTLSLLMGNSVRPLAGSWLSFVQFM